MQRLSSLDRAGCLPFRNRRRGNWDGQCFPGFWAWELGGGAGRGVLCEWVGDTIQRGRPCQDRMVLSAHLSDKHGRCTQGSPKQPAWGRPLRPPPVLEVHRGLERLHTGGQRAEASLGLRHSAELLRHRSHRQARPSDLGLCSQRREFKQWFSFQDHMRTWLRGAPRKAP